MDIKNGLKILKALKVDVDSSLMREIAELADSLPEPLEPPLLGGRDKLSSQLLISRLLQEFGDEIGVKFIHIDIIHSAYNPSVEQKYQELLDQKINRMRAMYGIADSELLPGELR